MNKKYVVIGGQYMQCCYGARPTLLGAKRLAGANCEYWDNWQGWHVPKIYRAEDCETIETETGKKTIVKPGVYPIVIGYLKNGKVKWEQYEDIAF